MLKVPFSENIYFEWVRRIRQNGKGWNFVPPLSAAFSWRQLVHSDPGLRQDGLPVTCLMCIQWYCCKQTPEPGRWPAASCETSVVYTCINTYDVTAAASLFVGGCTLCGAHEILSLPGSLASAKCTRQAMCVWRNNEVRPRNHCCCGKAISTTYLSVCVCVCVWVRVGEQAQPCACARIALLIQHATRRHNFICGSSVISFDVIY